MTEVKEKITVTELPIAALRSFEEHPYKVVDNEEMASLVESIYTQGILRMLTVAAEDMYEAFANAMIMYGVSTFIGGVIDKIRAFIKQGRSA